MLNIKNITGNILELIIFSLNSIIITYGLFKLQFINSYTENNTLSSIFTILIGIIGGTIIPVASLIFRKIIPKIEYSKFATISKDEFKSSIPFIISALICSIIVSNLFMVILLDIKSLPELIDVRKEQEFWIVFIIQLVFGSIEISPFFVVLLLNNKEQVILEQTKEISNINEQLKQSYETQLKIVNSIQHELGNKLPIVKFTISDLATHLTDLHKKGEININDKIRQPFEGESAGDISSIQSLIDIIEIELQNSVLIVQNMRAIVQTDFGKTRKIPTLINDFINDDMKFRIKQFPKNIRIEMDSEIVTVNLDQSQFKVLLDNIYTNAIRHSFVDNDKQYNLKIHIIRKKNKVEIIFMNNGEPFPEKMKTSSYTELNEFYGETGNSGIGGYLIGQVIRNHNGELYIDKRLEFQNFSTFITIKLPL